MRKRIKYIESLEEFNKILHIANTHTNLIKGNYEAIKYKYKASLATHSCYEDKFVTIELTTQYYEWKPGRYIPTTYIFRKDGEYKVVMKGSDCYMISQRYYKAPDYRKEKEIIANIGINKKGSFMSSASPLVGFNSKFDNSEHEVYIYDLNSAYAVQLMNKLPDTEEYRLYSIVNKNQVGFMFDGQLTMVTKPGLYADIVFNIVESPYKEFARKYYDMKKNATNKQDKLKAKNMLNLTVGYWQRTNPFLRAYVVHSCNNYIKSLIDENTCMWNTDAIYSIVPRHDLELGDDIGQWKLEYSGTFRQKGNNYQKVDKKDTAYRGTPKRWFNIDWNILKDKVPTTGNVYELDEDLMKVIEVEEYYGL